MPDTIQGIIAARMDRLEESLKRIMQVASVIGREFAYRILATITGMREDLKASLLNLQGPGVHLREAAFPGAGIHLQARTHPGGGLQQPAPQEQKGDSREDRDRPSKRLYAERLEEYYELLAYHYVRSDNKDKAVEYLDLANQKAAKANAMEDAKGIF